jgi:hypothetical protein
LRARTVSRLQCHDSPETFEPVKGRAVIFLARPSRPDVVKAFLLDKPIIIKAGVWHDVAAISKEAEIKICENSPIKTRYIRCREPITA